MIQQLKRKLLLKIVRSFVGKQVIDGGEFGTLVRCHECHGEGLLHKLDNPQVKDVSPNDL